MGQNRYPVKVDGQYGYIDKKGNVVIKPRFDYIVDFSNGFALYTQKDLTTVVVDTNGNNLFELKGNYPNDLAERTNPSHDYPFSFNDNRLAVFDTTTKKYGFIDKSAKWVIKPQFKHVTDFSEGLAAVGFWDNDPNHLMSTGSKEYSEHLASVKWGFIDTNGVMVIDTQYREVSAFHMGICLVDKNFIDRNGNKINPDTILDQELLCRLQSENSNFQYQKGGKYISSNSKFNSCGIVARENYDGISSSGRFGYVDCQNSWIIQPKFQNARNFVDGKAGVQRKISKGNFEWGFINCSGDTVMDFQFQHVGDFYQGVVPVCKNDKWGVVNERNEVVVPFEYANKWPIFDYGFKDGLILLLKDGKQNYFNSNGEIVWKEK
jgi:hypothetical protein